MTSIRPLPQSTVAWREQLGLSDAAWIAALAAPGGGPWIRDVPPALRGPAGRAVVLAYARAGRASDAVTRRCVPGALGALSDEMYGDAYISQELFQDEEIIVALVEHSGVIPRLLPECAWSTDRGGIARAAFRRSNRWLADLPVHARPADACVQFIFAERGYAFEIPPAVHETVREQLIAMIPEGERRELLHALKNIAS